MASLTLIFAISMFLPHKKTAKSFNTDCTVPTEVYIYIHGPNARRTTDILFNSLSIILLCTWNILHFNIPARQANPKSTLDKLGMKVTDSITNIEWMLLTVVAPECLVGKAFNEWLPPRYLPAAMNEWTKPQKKWEVTHGYYANMGGFVLGYSELEVPSPEAPAITEMSKIEANDNVTSKTQTDIDSPISPDIEKAPFTPQTLPRTLKEYLIQIIKEILQDKTFRLINISRMKHSLWALNIKQFDSIYAMGIIPDLASFPTARDLERLDKGDFLVKSIAILQSVWLAIQLLARHIGGLPSSQLEIVALAFTGPSILTYYFYLRRPNGISNVFHLKAKRFPTKGEITLLLDHGQYYLWTI